MRKLNMFLVIGMLLTFLIHALMGSLQLLGANADAMKTVARVSATFVAMHIVVTSIMTVRTLYARKKAGAGYFRDNLLFWTRRVSGFAIIIPLVMHLFIFMPANQEVYRLEAFTAGRMISQILLVAALALHILSNIKPAFISFGIKGHKEFGADLFFSISVLMLLFALAFFIYYLRWMRL